MAGIEPKMRIGLTNYALGTAVGLVDSVSCRRFGYPKIVKIGLLLKGGPPLRDPIQLLFRLRDVALIRAGKTITSVVISLTRVLNSRARTGVSVSLRWESRFFDAPARSSARTVPT